MGKTKIEWADKTYNPVTGCTKISEGCQNCYAERLTKRFWTDKDFSKVTLHPDRLDQPLKWKKPSKIFVCSMSDLFHEDVPTWMRFEVLDIIFEAKQHTFLVLTKRPQQMYDFFDWYYKKAGRTTEIIKNLWLGVTTENQRTADERIPILLQIPAAVRFVSVEPMLSPISLRWLSAWNGKALKPYPLLKTDHLDGLRKLSWVICGGESGPGARKMKYEWAYELNKQCQDAGVPFFYKQGPDDDGKWGKMPKLNGIIWDQRPKVET